MIKPIFAIAVARCEMSYGVYKKITTAIPLQYQCDYINTCPINLFVFSNYVLRVSWLSDREEGAFLYIKKPKCPENEVVYLVTLSCVVANTSFTRNKKIKNR